MRTGYVHSLIAALITSVSIATSAAPTAGGNVPLAQNMVVQVQPEIGKIDLNSADALTLQRELLGIGEAKAKAIVAYRESNGAFASVDELLEVKGIGKAILERNREKIEVNN